MQKWNDWIAKGYRKEVGWWTAAASTKSENGQRPKVITDSPFVEAKEVIGGYSGRSRQYRQVPVAKAAPQRRIGGSAVLAGLRRPHKANHERERRKHEASVSFFLSSLAISCGQVMSTGKPEPVAGGPFSPRGSGCVGVDPHSASAVPTWWRSQSGIVPGTAIWQARGVPENPSGWIPALPRTRFSTRATR